MIGSESSLETAPPRLAKPSEVPLVTRILVDAFDDDPMWGSWAFPAPETRRLHRESVFRLLVQGAMRYPHVWLTADDAATAIWIPPGETEMSEAQVDAIDSVLHQSLGARAEVVLQAFESFEAARPPDPHYYLTMLATSPSHGRRGIGRRLLRSNLRRVDQEQEAAYLEARDELVPWYERFGFRVVRRFDLRDGPTVNTMWREPRPITSHSSEP